MSLLSKFLSLITYDLGIDLGTSSTLVAIKGVGVVMVEPSVVAINRKTNQVLAVGNEAKKMVGRTPADIVAVRPLRDGVITDFEMTEAMLKYFIGKTHQQYAKFYTIPKPRVVIGVPSGVTEVEMRAVIDAAELAGAREVFIIEEPMAAAIGSNLPVEDPFGSMIIDIGGGTTDIAIISLGQIVVDATIKIAGDEMDQAIIDYLREKKGVVIGDRTAEIVKIEIGSAMEYEGESDFEVKGRESTTGLPTSITVTPAEIREAILPILQNIADASMDAIEKAPPEILSDLIDRGVTVAGGGAKIKKLSEFLSAKFNCPVFIANDPISAVVRGTLQVLEEIEILKRIQK